ncbi:MAG: cyclopropane fatty acyl phospholipid synthase [Thermodesulfobacteriota bacterium]|nr:cyclopropane fatty acyl phospholipid synthase [Thermodesulfobacteriota bacterium]
MRLGNGKKAVKKILDQADIQIDGHRPWDIRVNNPAFYERILASGSMALGESYMDVWWDCDALDQFFHKVLSAELYRKIRYSKQVLLEIVKAKVTNFQRKSKAFEVGKRHYDIGNDLFAIMLDEGMNYSCGYWQKAKTLAAAQEAKLDLICRKVGLSPGMTVLDIGCGWGGFARYATENYQVNITGITVSREQVKWAKEYCQGFPAMISLKDYRDQKGTFDRIISIGMFEHVGVKNYHAFMKVVHRCLKSDGLFLLHTIGGNRSVGTCDPWLSKYIFTNGMLPSARQITLAAEGLFILEDWQSFGPHYDTTLMAWHDNFIKGWEQLSSDYDERFYRMWTYYLLCCAGSFRARDNQLWQIVFSKKGVSGGYQRI